MKTIKILLLVSILTVTQSFAFSKTQRNILLGIGAGAIIIHTLESHNNNRYEKPHNKIVYVNSHRKHKKHQMRKNHNRGHNHYSRSNRHNKHYRRNHHRYDSLAVNNHNRRAYSRY